SHAALFALAYVIFQLQTDRVAALVAEVRRIGVVCAAFLAEHIAGVKRVSDDGGSAVLAGRAEVVQPFQMSALALPLADGVGHDLQLRNITKISDWKHRLKNRLQTRVVAFTG